MDLLAELRTSIHEEHADEASFLCEQRARWLDDAAVSFDAVAELEERREAHLDGLYLGGDTALRLTAARALQGEDAGIVDTALRLACRHARADICSQILESVADSAEAELLRAASMALCAELPSAFTRLAQDGLRAANETLMALWARVVGYRRLPLSAQLRAALTPANVQPAHTAELIWALGELGEPCPLSSREALSSGSPALVQAVLLATLKHAARTLTTSDFEALEQPFAGWAAVPRVLAGFARYDALARGVHAADGDGRQQAIIALGLLGRSEATGPLLELLADAETAHPAAVALQLLTGANLLETVEVAEVEDPGLDPDLEEPETGAEAPERKSTETRLCQDAARWSTWLEESAALQERGSQLRWGAPLSELQTLLALSHTALPLRVRGWLADELRIRLKHDIVFHPDMTIARQRAALHALQAWIAARPKVAAAGWS